MHSTMQPLFGIKTPLTVAFGTFLAGLVFEQWQRPLRTGSRRSGARAVIGVLANAVIDFPWTGLVDSVGDIDRKVGVTGAATALVGAAASCGSISPARRLPSWRSS